MGMNCMFRGAGNLLQALQSEEDIVPNCRIEEISCLHDRCDHARKSPIVRVNETIFENASAEVILEAVHTLLIKEDGREEP